METDSSNNEVIYNISQEQDPDKAILAKIRTRIDRHEPKFTELRKRAKDNAKYYYNDIVDESYLKVGESNTSVPKLFENLETLIPHLTRATPEPNITVVAREDNKESDPFLTAPKKQTRIKLQASLPYFLKDKWNLSKLNGGADMQSKQTENFRNLFTQGVMIYKLRANPKNPTVLDVVVVSVDDCLFPIDSESDSDLQFFIYYNEASIGELLEMGFEPDSIQKLVDYLKRTKGGNISKKSIIKYCEYWESDKVIFEYNEEVVFGVIDNPLWNKEGNNHFTVPAIPVIIEADIVANSGLVSKTTYIEVCKPMVNLINKRKQQVDRNADLTNGIMIVNGNAVDEKNAQNLGTDTTQVIYIKPDVTAPKINDAVQILTARAIDTNIMADMEHAERHIDLVTGVNDTLRGDRSAQETAEGRKILKESILARSELLFRLNEHVASKFYNWSLQLLYVTDAKIAASDGSVFETKYLQDNKVTCYCKEGSTIPQDRATEQTQAFERFKVGLISRKRALEILGEPDPVKTAKEVYLEQANPEALYNPVVEIEPEAVMHIYDLIKGDVEPNTFSMSPENVETATKHIKTHQDYIDGKEVDGDLPSFTELNADIRQLIIYHTQEEANMLAQLVGEVQTTNPNIEQASPDMAQSQEQVMPEQQVPNPEDQLNQALLEKINSIQ